MPKPLTVWLTTKYGKLFKRWEYQTTWPAYWEICMQIKKQHLEPICCSMFRVFSKSQFFTSGGQNIGASVSASVFPMTIQDWFPLGLTGLISLQSKGLSKSLLQHHSSKASILRHSAFFMVQLSHPYMTTGKTIALTRQTFVGKLISLLFNMLNKTLNMEQQTGSKLGKEYINAVYCHLAYLTYMQSTSHKMLIWIKHKLESRLLGEISITSDMQMTPPLWQRAKRNWRAFWWKWKKRVKKLLKIQHSVNEDNGIQCHHFMANRWGNSGNSDRLYFGGS